MISSSNKKKNINLRWRQASQFEDTGDLKKALKIRKELFSEFPNDKTILLAVADTYEKLNYLSTAEKMYRKIVRLHPKWELGSKFLFHFYWDDDNVLGVDRKDDAFDEMRRFQAISHCEDYVEICLEINEKYGDKSEEERMRGRNVSKDRITGELR